MRHRNGQLIKHSKVHLANPLVAPHLQERGLNANLCGRHSDSIMLRCHMLPLSQRVRACAIKMQPDTSRRHSTTR